ncbi:hypothetical protein EBT31_19450, partial [bacterium]|nr:hypothetical protein [bacterium]
MATNIDKALYQAPQGSLDFNQSMPPVEIEIENPDAVTIGLGDLEIQLKPEPKTADTFDANLAEYMDDGELQALASELLSDFEDDISSRKDW